MCTVQIGGSRIEAWSANETVAGCQNTTVGGPTAYPPAGHLYYGMVCPFVNMSIAGWIWYQVGVCLGTHY